MGSIPPVVCICIQTLLKYISGMSTAAVIPYASGILESLVHTIKTVNNLSVIEHALTALDFIALRYRK